MKRILLIPFIVFVLFACKSKSKITSQTEHMDVVSQKALKGDWEITDIKFSGPEYYKVTAFQIADYKCFIGSDWNFIPNSNKGRLKLDKADCPEFSSTIDWSINKQGMFGLKIPQGIKSRKTDEGFMLRFKKISDDSFELVDNIEVGGSQKEIIYHFEKQ